MKPLVSVIIPTANRPHYLPRAVESALAGMDSKDIEVIIVPNGADQSWRKSLVPFRSNPSVRVIPINEANANIARNTGMKNAKGDFIRFLDDDDYLISRGAIKQYELLKETGADVVSGGIKKVDETGKCFAVKYQLDEDDFCVAMLGALRNTITTAHVYRLSSLDGLRWGINTKVHQDYEWNFLLCEKKELFWVKTRCIVGVYFKHSGIRISTSPEYNYLREKTIIPMLLNVYQNLLEQDRLNDNRKYAISQGLWSSIHRAFYLEPSYWMKIAKLAQDICPQARPIQPIYFFPIIRKINPLVIQLIMFPKRYIIHVLNKLIINIRIHT